MAVQPVPVRAVTPSPPSPAILVSAHRGGLGEFPENSLAAFRAVTSAGFPVEVELDVYKLVDGTLAVHHDATIPETCTAFVGRAINELTWDQVSTIRCNGEPVPMFRDALGVIAAAPHARVAVDLKLTRGATDADHREYAREVARVLVARGMVTRSVVTTFYYPHVQGVNDVNPDIPTNLTQGGDLPNNFPGISWGRWVPSFNAVLAAKKVGADSYGYSASFTNVTINRYAASIGMGVTTWTEEHGTNALRMKQQGIRTICTNYPTRLAAAVAKPHSCTWTYATTSKRILPKTWVRGSTYVGTGLMGPRAMNATTAPQELVSVKVTTTLSDLRIAPSGSAYGPALEVPVAKGTSTVLVRLAPGGNLRVRSASGRAGYVQAEITRTWSLACSYTQS